MGGCSMDSLREAVCFWGAVADGVLVWEASRLRARLRCGFWRWAGSRAEAWGSEACRT